MNADYSVITVRALPTADGERRVDVSAEYAAETVEKYFRGDYYAYCRKYFGEVSRIADDKNADVVSCFDLVASFNAEGKYFDETHPKYVMPALVAIERLCAAEKIFEVNTAGGRVAPSSLLLSSVYELGGKIAFAPDADIELAKAAARECGFDCAYMLAGGKLAAVEI